MGIQVPENYGGAGMSAIGYCICLEELARVDPSISLSVAAHNGLAVAHLLLFASEAQKQQYLVPLAEGKTLGGWALTEASSGSDAAAMRTQARADGDGWVLNGSKQFITHGAIADTLVITAVTDRQQGSRGISAFIVPRGTKGLSAGKKENKLGMRASDTSEVILTDCRVPGSAIIGAPGEGFLQAMQVLDAGRIGIAALAVGLAEGAFDASRRYAHERRPVRPADFRVPGDSLEACRHGDADSGSPAPHVSRCMDARSEDRTHLAGVIHRQALLQRNRRASRRGVRADSWRVWICEGLPGGKVFPRRQTLHDR